MSGKTSPAAPPPGAGLDEEALEKISGKRQAVTDRVRGLALLAKESGCGGVVASPQEIGVVKDACGKDFVVVTPGIRMGAAKGKDDQARTLTPAEAAKAGADYIVVGRIIQYHVADLHRSLHAIADNRGANGPPGSGGGRLPSSQQSGD